MDVWSINLSESDVRPDLGTQPRNHAPSTVETPLATDLSPKDVTLSTSGSLSNNETQPQSDTPLQNGTQSAYG